MFVKATPNQTFHDLSSWTMIIIHATHVRVEWAEAGSLHERSAGEEIGRGSIDAYNDWGEMDE